jgi:hypothetical protein
VWRKPPNTVGTARHGVPVDRNVYWGHSPCCPNPVTASWTESRVLCSLSDFLTVWNIHQQQYHVILASLACLRQPMRPTIALD